MLALPGAASAQNPFYTVFFIAGSQPLIEEQSSVPTGTHRSDGIVVSTDTTFHTTQGALAMTVQDVCTPRVMGTANSTQPPAATEQSSRRDAVVFNPSYKICAMGGRKGGAPRCGITQLRYKPRHTVGRTDPHIIIGLLSQHLASMIAWAQLSRTIDGQWEARAARSGVNSSSALPRLGRAWSATSHLRARAA